jgi:hypothetical protein
VALQQQALDWLRLASLDAGSTERLSLYDDLVTRYSERGVFAMIDDLTDRGYLQYEVSPRRASLTEKGSQELAAL